MVRCVFFAGLTGQRVNSFGIFAASKPMNEPPRKQLGNNMECYFCGSGYCCRELKFGKNTTVYVCKLCCPLWAKIWEFLTIAGLLLGGLIGGTIALMVGVVIFASAYGLAESWVRGILGSSADQRPLLMTLLSGVITVCIVGG
jgi:hypothetical protein